MQQTRKEVLVQATHQALAVRATIFGGRAWIARTAHRRGEVGASLCRDVAVTVRGPGGRSVSDEGEQHEGQHARERRMCARRCRCVVVTGH
ncbi:MAG: hypothetical protein QOD00_4070 [Blastocatellia bacterium]|nr:hypothetical protein [Blastocatellia bacterium]